MRPGLEIMLESANERDSVKLQAFTRSAINDFVEKVKNVDESILKADIKEKTLTKLGAIDLLSGSFAHNFTEKNLEEYYEELNLKGDEDLVEVNHLNNFAANVAKEKFALLADCA